MRKIFTILVLLLAFQGCGDSYQLFSTKYRVRFSFSTNIPPYNQVQSLGLFVSMRRSGQNIIATTADGREYTIPMNESEARSFLMGLGGVLVGTPALNNDKGSVWAFDLACPVCDQAKHRLTFNALGVAHCAGCNTSFDLNNSGFVISSDANETRPLYRYPVTISGNTITVAN